MKKYLSIFKLRFIYGLQYRAAALAGISTQIFFGFVFISVYLAFYESNPSANTPMKWQELVSYIWLNQAFLAMINLWVNDNDLLSMIKNGNIAYEFVRPMHFYKKWFATMYANRLSSTLLRMVPLIIFALLLPYPYKLGLPYSLNSFLVFILTLIISSLIVNAFTMIYHLITFFTLDQTGVGALFKVGGEILSGGTVPLAFFPKFLYNIAYVLPFRFICDLPFRVYSGSISVNDALPDLIIGVVWVIVLISIGFMLSKRISKKVIVQGG